MSTKESTKKASKKSTKKSEVLNFEASMLELESLVARMEQGEQSLEDSLIDFERGITLTRRCQISLQETEQKIQQLIEKNGQDELVDFDEE